MKSKSKSIFALSLIITLSLATLATASFAWFSFNVNNIASIVAQSGNIEISSYELSYLRLDTDTQTYQTASEAKDSSGNYSYDLNGASVSSISGFGMNYYDPYLKVIQGTSAAESSNLLIKIDFSVSVETEYAITVAADSITDFNAAYSVFTNYTGAENAYYVLSDIVYFQIIPTSDITGLDQTSDETIYQTATSFFQRESGPTEHSFEEISSKDTSLDEKITMISESIADVSAARTDSYSFVINIDYRQSVLDDLITEYGENFVLSEPYFLRNFFFDIEADQQ